MKHSGRVPSISAIGLVSWDELYVLDSYPPEGGYAVVRAAASAPGGTTGNIAMTARKLGATVDLHSVFGTDWRAEEIAIALQQAGVTTRSCLRREGETDLSVVLVSRQSSERTIIWRRGPHIQRGDPIDVQALFGPDLTVIDCADYELRKFLTDLPAHTRPDARLLGTLTYLSDVVASDKVEVALRHDMLIGNEREYRELLGLDDAESCLAAIVALMPGANLRLAVMTRGEQGSVAASRESLVSAPARQVNAIDSTGAGDAFTGAFAFAQALRWDIQRSLTFANGVASCVVTELGAQTGLPTLAEACRAAGISR